MKKLISKICGWLGWGRLVPVVDYALLRDIRLTVIRGDRFVIEGGIYELDAKKPIPKDDVRARRVNYLSAQYLKDYYDLTNEEILTETGFYVK